MLLLQELVTRFTYAGILAALMLGSLGVPIPEEMVIVAAGILSHEGLARWWLALPVCLLGVLSGDVVLYWVERWAALVGLVALTGAVIVSVRRWNRRVPKAPSRL